MLQYNQKELILSLIKDDLTNTKLLDGLTALGLDADTYMLGIFESVLKMMGLDKSISKYEGLLESYLELSEKVRNIDITQSRKPLEALSLEIYLEIEKYK